MRGRFLSHPELAALLRASAAPGAALLVGVDGAGGSGKTTLARHLATHLGAGRSAPGRAERAAPSRAERAAPSRAERAALVHMDDFYHPTGKRFRGPVGERPVGADYDRERLAREVLVPLRAGQPARYRRYSWTSDTLEPESTEVSGPLVVVEGVYATSAPLRRYYDITLWVECPRELRLQRGLARDGAAAHARWIDWMAGEDLYIAREDPRQHATFVCAGHNDRPTEGVWLLEGPRPAAHKP